MRLETSELQETSALDIEYDCYTNKLAEINGNFVSDPDSERMRSSLGNITFSSFVCNTNV